MSPSLYLGVVLSSKHHPWLQFEQGWVSSSTWQVNEVTFRGSSFSHRHIQMEIKHRVSFSLSFSQICSSQMVLYSTSYTDNGHTDALYCSRSKNIYGFLNPLQHILKKMQGLFISSFNTFFQSTHPYAVFYIPPGVFSIIHNYLTQCSDEIGLID